MDIMSSESSSKRKSVLDHKNPEDFLVSQWQSTPKSCNYVVYRWIIAIFFVLSVFMSTFADFQIGALSTHFIYFTNLNLTLTMLANVMSAVLSTQYYTGTRHFKGKMTSSLKIFWFLSSTTVPSSCLASWTYWTVIHDPEIYRVDLTNILVHVTNSLVLLIDICIVRQPASYSVMICPVTVAVGYLIFTWLYPFLGGVNK